MPVRKVNYCYLTVPSRAGQGEQILGALRKAGVDLLAFSGFPGPKRKAQIDLVAEHLGPIRSVAREHGWRLSKSKKGFLIDGANTIGAVHRHVRRLAERNINITAATAVTAGKRRYGMLLWVKAKDYGRAARALKAR